MNRQSSWKRVGMMGLVLLLFLSLVGCEQNRQGGEEETEERQNLPVKRIQQALCPRSAQEFGNNTLRYRETHLNVRIRAYILCARIYRGKSFLLYGDHGSGYAGETLRKAGLRPYGPGLQCLLFLNGNERLLL